MLRVRVQLFGDEQNQRRDRYKVASVVYKNQRNTYTYKLSKASPLFSLHDKMGENSDGRTVEVIKTSIQSTAAPNSMMKNQTNATNPPGEQR